MIRALIVDDEVFAREAVRDILTEDGSFELLKDCCNGKEALTAIRQDRPDVVFLDMRMPVMDGLEVVEKLGVQNMPLTIFVTAHDEFAIRAFEAQALDYVLKPLDEDRLCQTIVRIKRQLRLGAPGNFASGLRGIANAKTGPFLDRIAVRTRGRLIFLQTAEIRWIESAGNYVKLVTTNESILMRESLNNLEMRLDPSRFVRIHRCTIVNIQHIVEVRPWYTGERIVVLEGGKELTLTRRFRASLKRMVRGIAETADREEGR